MSLSTTTTPARPVPAFLFIPDISGFTQFVNDTEINHARHIVEELLNILIESNQIQMEVSEVEGDAILFCRLGDPPTARELFDQIRQMFTAFHLHVQKYDTHRICNCGACKTASTLTLKFIAHYGDVAINQVQQFKKLFGLDVITVHRLLKNDIEKHEYALFTEALVSRLPDWNAQTEKAWSPVKQSSQAYDSGVVQYDYLQLEALLDELPPLTADDFKIKGRLAKVLETETKIDAPLELVFDVISDVTWRVKWIPGTLPETTNMNSYFAQSGQTHKCMAKGPVIVAHDFETTKDKIYFSETDVNKSYCNIYEVSRAVDGSTRVCSILYIPKNLIKENMFKLLMKRKLQKVYEASWANLNAYCMSLVNEHKHHAYHIQLQ